MLQQNRRVVGGGRKEGTAGMVGAEERAVREHWMLHKNSPLGRFRNLHVLRQPVVLQQLRDDGQLLMLVGDIGAPALASSHLPFLAAC